MVKKKLTDTLRTALSIGSKSRSPSPEPGPSTGESRNIDSPFTRFVLSNLDDQDHKMVAMAFAPQIQTDCDARNLDFDDFFHLLGHKTKGDAIRTLNRVFKDGEIVFSNPAKNSVGRPKNVYMLSVNEFEELLLAANTDDGKKWRKLVLKIKNLVVQYMKKELEVQAAQFNVEMVKHTAEMKAVAEADRTLLVKQLEDMRLTRFWLYAFKLGDRRFKIGYAANVDERERQHQTTCPTGRNVHIVRVNTKYTEKLLDSVLKKHLNHVRGEEYEIEEGDRVVLTILNTIARVEEAVHTLPYDQFDNLLGHVDAALRGDKVVKSKDGRVAQNSCDHTVNTCRITSS